MSVLLLAGQTDRDTLIVYSTKVPVNGRMPSFNRVDSFACNGRNCKGPYLTKY